MTSPEGPASLENIGGRGERGKKGLGGMEGGGGGRVESESGRENGHLRPKGLNYISGSQMPAHRSVLDYDNIFTS